LGGRVGVVPFWGWTGGSGPVFGVAGWEWSRVRLRRLSSLVFTL
jgi:hypothetical protein